MQFNMKVVTVGDMVKIVQDPGQWPDEETILIVMDAEEAVELGTALVNAGWPLTKTKRR